MSTLAAIASACSSDGRDSDAGAGTGGIGAGETSGGGSLDTTGASLDDGGIKLDVPAGSEEGPSSEEECGVYTEEAEVVLGSADIIVVVDNSGSMDFEAASVQENLNAFSSQIIASGVDARVVLISSYPGDGNGICIAPPLGSGGCDSEDNNPPLFTHVDQHVGSNEALIEILAHHDDWAAVIRPGSELHIVIVTDDESDLDAAAFNEQFLALDPGYEGYKLHGIVGISFACEEVADVGTAYMDLAKLTGGLIHDLCEQNFQPVFDLLATEVVSGSKLSCEWPIPQPPAGDTFDPDRVNVEFDDGAGTRTIGRVDSSADCAGVDDGWYYDDPAAPALIIACPQTCEAMQAAAEGQVSITLGCATVPAG